MPAALAGPVAADDVLSAARNAGITHAVTVPDTNQRTVLDLMSTCSELEVLRAATEDDVLGICAGLWLAGRRPVAVIQQLGLFASANALRAFTHDQRVPLAILAGLYGREVDRPVHASAASAVRLCCPLLDALDIGWVLVEGHADAHLIEPGLAAAFDGPCTSVVLLGAPTA